MTKKTLHDYLLINKKQYKFQIKVASEISDDAINCLEDVFKKYGIVDITKPKKTIFQTSPIDFPKLKAAEVFIFDVTFDYPTTSQMVLEDVKKCLRLEETHVVVYNADNIPYDKKTEKTIYDNERSGKSVLLQDYESNIKKDDYVGDKYNQKMIKAINKHNKDNPVMSEYEKDLYK